MRRVKDTSVEPVAVSIARSLDKIINKGVDVTVCLPGAKIEAVRERVGQVMGNGHGGSIIEKEGTTAIIDDKYRKLVCTRIRV